MRPLVAAAALLLAACTAPQPRSGPVRTGLDRLAAEGFASLKGKRVGVVGNHTSKTSDGRTIVEALGAAEGVELVAVFSPEHGFTGVQDEFRISSTTVRVGDRVIPVHSLYSGGIASMRPTPEQLAPLDVLIFDIQDIGARFYTYLASMGMALEEAAKAKVAFWVLDRPNPIGGTRIEGPILEDLSLRLVTPTAYFAVPVRHGLTAGEMARLHNAEVGHPGLKVVEAEGWSRGAWFDQTGLPWTAPSPNMPDLEAATLYPGIAIFEASNIAVGRGTPIPFRWIGAPWLDAAALAARANAAGLPGVSFSTQTYTPSKSVFQGQECPGVRVHLLDREKAVPTDAFLVLNDGLRALHPDRFVWRWDEAKRMTGTETFRKLYEAGATLSEMRKLFARDVAAFAERRKPYLLYR